MGYLQTVLVALLLSGQVARVSADPQDMVDPEHAVRLVNQGIIISLDELMSQHRFLNQGRMLDLELEYDEEWPFIYEVSMLGSDGYIVEYEFDAATGNLIQEEYQE